MNSLNIRNWSMLFGVSALGMLGNSCNNTLLQRQITEGVIEYALTFPGHDPNSLMAGMLPEKTTLSFMEGRQVAELSAGMGVFKTSMIADDELQQMDYQLSVLSKRMIARLHERDLALFNKDLSAMTIVYTDQVDTVAGYPCHKAVAIFDNIDQPEIELYYTDRIQLENPNWFGPFAEIPGVLLSYELVQYGMRMKLDATTVTPGPVDPAKFKPHTDYQHVAPEVLHHELQEVVSTFTL